MPLGSIYKFYGRCYHINDLGYEIETDVKIQHVSTIQEALDIQSEFIAKNTPVEEVTDTVEQVTETVQEDITTTENI